MVRAINRAGMISVPALSNGFTIDPTPTRAGYVIDRPEQTVHRGGASDPAIPGSGNPLSTFSPVTAILLSSSRTTHAVSWGGFSDDEYRQI